jgi:hypothetical protein
MLMTQEKEVIVILSSDQNMLDWLPIRPIIRKVSPAKTGQYNVISPIHEYLKTVEECPFYIRGFDDQYVRSITDPKSLNSEVYFFTAEAREGYGLTIITENKIENKAKQMIGCYVGFNIYYGSFLGAYSAQFVSGRMIFLPPPTKVSVEKAIDLIVNILTGAELIEPPPIWENKVDLPGLKDIEDQILQKEKERETIIKDIKKYQAAKDALLRFRRLLWTKGTPLEDIVKDAFIFLGFTEIRKIREKNLEDWVIDFKFIKEYQHGVFEIKGADERTSLADLTQCNKWVEDYMLENKKTKGIFVTNQYRVSDISTNQKKREHFEENEKDYARKREICILPSHEVFFAVIEKMKNNPKITRRFIEEKIAASKGICKLSQTE